MCSRKKRPDVGGFKGILCLNGWNGSYANNKRSNGQKVKYSTTQEMPVKIEEKKILRLKINCTFSNPDMFLYKASY